MGRRGPRRKLERCIYEDNIGRSIAVEVRGVRQEKRFPPNTPIPFLRERLKQLRLDLNEVAPVPVRGARTPIPVPLKRSLEGWCYLYFVQIGEFVKIGRAVDLRDRMKTLQVSHPQEVRLLAAVPAHASLEGALHQHFQHLRSNGEWFAIAPELEEFIVRVRAGFNPVAMLW